MTIENDIAWTAHQGAAELLALNGVDHAGELRRNIEVDRRGRE